MMTNANHAAGNDAGRTPLEASMASTLPTIPCDVASRHYPALSDALAAGRAQLRCDPAAESVAVRGISEDGFVVEKHLRFSEYGSDIVDAVPPKRLARVGEHSDPAMRVRYDTPEGMALQRRIDMRGRAARTLAALASA